MNYISIQSSKDVIQHFGIKGMKWGHRKKKFYEKRGYLKNPTKDKAGISLSDMGKIRRNMGLTRRDFMFNPKYRDKANAEISRITNLKEDIRRIDYSLKNPKREGVHISNYGSYLKGKDLKEFNERKKFHNSKKNRHPEYLDFDDFDKWVKNYERMDELGTKGAQIRRKKLISDYNKFSD